jgi:hypothetical protein
MTRIVSGLLAALALGLAFTVAVHLATALKEIA